jgi:hypothetical protein
MVLVASTGAASAQATNNTTAPSPPNITVDVSTDQNSPDQNLSAGCSERIESGLRLCGSKYENGAAVVELLSDGPDSLTLTDVAKFMKGGEMNRGTVTIYEGRNTVRFPATRHKGFSGVSIDTGNTLYAVPITQVQNQSSRPAISYGNVQGLLAVTAVGAGAFTFLSVRRKRDDEDKDVERIL